MVAPVVELGIGELLTLMYGLNRVVEREPVPEQPQRVGVAGGLVGAPSTAEIRVVESWSPSRPGRSRRRACGRSSRR